MLILCVEEIMYLLSVDVSKMLLRRYWTCWRQTFRQVWRVASKKQEAKHSKDVSWERMGRRHFQWEIFNFVDIRSSAGDVDDVIFPISVLANSGKLVNVVKVSQCTISLALYCH